MALTKKIADFFLGKKPAPKKVEPNTYNRIGFINASYDDGEFLYWYFNHRGYSKIRMMMTTITVEAIEIIDPENGRELTPALAIRDGNAYYWFIPGIEDIYISCVDRFDYIASDNLQIPIKIYGKETLVAVCTFRNNTLIAKNFAMRRNILPEHWDMRHIDDDCAKDLLGMDFDLPCPVSRLVQL